MINCIPRGICSWDFLLRGNDFNATTAFSYWSESGSITANQTTFTVEKESMFGGPWNLLAHDGVIASAKHCHLFTRAYDLDTEHGQMKLKPASVMTRAHDLIHRNQTIVEFRPTHAFTRRATAEIYVDDCEHYLIVFAFWLTVLNWRRATQAAAAT